MPIEEAKKRELVAGITAILRQSPLHATLDTQRLAMAFSMVLDNVEPGQPIDLQHLYQWLVSQKANEKDALELCVVLKLREDKLGAQFTAPAKAQYMDQLVLDELAARFQTKADRGQGWDKKAAEPSPPPPPAQKATAWAPKKRGQQKTNRVFPVLLGASLLAGIGYWGWMLTIANPPLRPVTVADTAGLKCTELKANERVAICTITRQQFAAEPVDAIKTRADVTLRELSNDHGSQIIYVMVDGRLKIRRP
ncbi:MAG: hypothetical protein A2138_14585 [Deltaproteobacteria bacterium RBG_16_71_12]|nr:MAG: hypothetical protein A2138_14585 [Deltaproteobacteria bacterium RBG_16_71_12]